jgi:O-acetylhomoserine (thiol)-lyase
MKLETKAIHSGYEVDPATKAVAVPIYQTVAYAFDSADHAAALFNLEADGFRYTRIQNPTTAVLERRVAALEGGLKAMGVSSGQAAVNYAVLNVTQLGCNIVSVPQLYGTTHTLFAHILPSQGVSVRFAASDRAEDIARLIDANTRAVFCESVGNPAGNICDLEALARVAHEHGVPLIVDNTVASPVLLRPIEFGADIVVNSLTKFLGGHGTTLGGAIVDSGRFDWKANAARFPIFTEPDASITAWFTPIILDPRPTSNDAAAFISAPAVQSFRRSVPSCCCRGLRPLPCAWSVTWRMEERSPSFSTAIRALSG